MNSIVSRDLSVHQEHELLLKLEQAGLNSKMAQKVIESKNNRVAKEMIEVISDELSSVITVEIETKSLLDLREEYGTGEGGFYDNDWWLNEEFAESVPEPGIYEVNVEKQLVNMTYDEQVEAIPEGWDFPHPAVIAQVILKHHKETGENLLKDWWTLASLTGSDGRRVRVGYFDSCGLSVRYVRDDIRVSYIGVVTARKTDK